VPWPAQLVQLVPQWAESLLVQAVQAWSLHHCPDGQELEQVPLQPSEAPPHLPVQSGTHEHWWLVQESPEAQSLLELQPQEPL